MAKIDELVKQARDELCEKEMYLEDLDNKIKTFFKAKKSAFDDMKSWIVNKNNMSFTYNFYVQSNRYIIYVTFKICDEKERIFKWVKVKLINIIRM